MTPANTPSEPPHISSLREQLGLKKAALNSSHTAVNALSSLIVSAVNGEAIGDDGRKLSVTDVVKASDALRQVHDLLCSEVAALEKQLAVAIRKEADRPRREQMERFLEMRFHQPNRERIAAELGENQ